MKKVVLALPNFRWRESSEHLLWDYIPYGLCMLAAVIESRYDVTIIDAYKENLTPEDFAERIANEKPFAVGIGVLIDYFGATLHLAANIVKKVNPSIKVIAGGVYATTNVERVLSNSNVDYLIAGEGEVTLPLLLDKIAMGGNITEDGIYYYHNGNLLGKGRSRYIEDLDNLPLPAYHKIDYMSYISGSLHNRVNLPSKMPYSEIFTSRGCPYHCCFCQVGYILGRNFRARSAKNVLKEVDWLIERYGVKSIVVMDDNFLVNRNRAIEVMRGFASRGLAWQMANTAIFLVDDELLEVMAGTGCRNISYAIESGTYRVLHDVVHKPIKSFEQVIHNVRKAQELGIYVEANFIIGFPSETWTEIRETLRFAEELGTDYVRIFTAIPLQHTEMYQECVNKNCLAKGYDPENVDWKTGFIETEEFSKDDLLILRTYEWDRINFADESKRKKAAKTMGISEQDLSLLRKRTRDSARQMLGISISKG